MNGTYQPLLVLLSVVVAMVASYTALDLANSITVARGRGRLAWLLGGALAMGMGIWSMHFIGMLAFRIPGMPIAYDVPLLILSVAVAIVASAFALFVVSRPTVRLWTLVVASLAMGAAIAGMHYIGMASMHMPARLQWNRALVLASIAIAILASFAALWLAFHYRRDSSNRARWIRLGGGVVEGVAIAGMHYTGMAAARFLPHSGEMTISRQDVLATSGLAAAVFGSTLLLLFVALAGSVVGRELARRKDLARENERLYHESHDLATRLEKTVQSLRLRTLEAERSQQEAERARDEAERSARRLRAVQSITDVTITHLEVEELLQELLRRICATLSCDTAALLLLSSDARTLTLRASVGLEEETAHLGLPLGQGIAGRIASGGEPLIVPDTREVEGTSPALRERVRSLMGVPLKVENRITGVLHVGTSWQRTFSAEDLELLRLVAERSAYTLERARLFEAAMAASRTKSEFLASMSHELRTPLNAIDGYVELLDLGIGDEEKRKGYLGRIRTSSRHLLGLINDILDFAKLESGQLEINRERGSLWGAVEDALSLIEPQARQQGIALTSRCNREGDALFHGDGIRVRQIVTNLLSNAVKFTDPGGEVRVECGTTRTPPAESGLARGEEWSYIRVVDTGIGIAPEQQERVFQPFVQADSSLTRSRGGTGLGLTISRQLARSMGGEITLESEPGRGSTLTLYLPPFAPPPAEEALPSEAEAPVFQRAGTLLQQENSELMARLTRRLRERLPVAGIGSLSEAELEDHQATFFSDIAQALIVLGSTGGEPQLLRTNSDIQHLIAVRHGEQRAALGWTEEALIEEFAWTGVEVEETLRRARPPLEAQGREAVLEVIRRLLETALEASLRALRSSREPLAHSGTGGS